MSASNYWPRGHQQRPENSKKQGEDQRRKRTKKEKKNKKPRSETKHSTGYNAAHKMPVPLQVTLIFTGQNTVGRITSKCDMAVEARLSAFFSRPWSYVHGSHHAIYVALHSEAGQVSILASMREKVKQYRMLF